MMHYYDILSLIRSRLSNDLVLHFFVECYSFHQSAILRYIGQSQISINHTCMAGHVVMQGLLVVIAS